MTKPVLPADPGWMGDLKRGASLGRPSTEHGPAGKLYLRRLRLNNGGYDAWGGYWGIGAPLYWATDGGIFDVYLRAADRDDAKAQLRQRFPGVEFYR